MAEKVLVRVISGVTLSYLWFYTHDCFSIVPITFFLETVTKKCFYRDYILFIGICHYLFSSDSNKFCFQQLNDNLTDTFVQIPLFANQVTDFISMIFRCNIAIETISDFPVIVINDEMRQETTFPVSFTYLSHATNPLCHQTIF